QTFYGTILLNQSDSGSINNKVTFSSYGMGRATIYGGSGSGLNAADCKNIILKNLNFTGIGRKDGNTEDGVVFNRCSNIVIDSLDISGFQHSGLVVMNEGYNINIRNVNAHENGFAGIFVYGTDKKSVSQIYIGHCITDNNPGDPTVTNNHSGNGILGYQITNLIIEYCKASNNGWDMPRIGNGPGGIWVTEADSVIIQYCISHDNKTSPGAKDGVGFDLDGGTTNSLIQYCLSYNNHGAGFGIYQYSDASDWNNNTIRYCISENDGNISANGNVEIWNGTIINSEFKNLEFYNNVIYNESKPALYFLNHKNAGFNFRNNIFVSGSGKIYERINGENSQGNCWFSIANNTTQDSLDFITWALANNQEMLNGEIVGIYTNPRFVNPGNSNLTNPLLLATTDDYKLKVQSVLTDKGFDLETLFNINPGDRDYFGVPIQQGMAFNIGVDQFADNQQIGLSAGWNIFSANLVPADSNLMNILQPLIDSGRLKKVMDEEGNTIEDRGVYGGWTNTIGNIKFTEGYSINVNSSSTFEIRGGRIHSPVDIFLKKGWNIISWPAQTEQDGLNVFQTLIADGKLKKVMNEAGTTIEDRGVFGGWVNDIGNLAPGEGYKVNVTEDCSLTVEDNSLKSEKILPTVQKTTYFTPAYEGNGANHMNFYLVELPQGVLNIGDELAIFDKEICVGSVKVQPHHLKTPSISIITSAADNLGANGFFEGNTFTLKLWDSQQKRETDIIFSVLRGSSRFIKNGSTFLSLKNLPITTFAETAGLAESKISCFPNPFSTGLTVEINLENDSKVQVEVLNQLGQRVKILYPKSELNSGTHQIRWNGENSSSQRVSAGIYLVRATIGDNIFYEKVICQ
ncbi:MAG: T9SS type A sorting domain-containing protein, partial [Bacteroidetes bacterium]